MERGEGPGPSMESAFEKNLSRTELGTKKPGLETKDGLLSTTLASSVRTWKGAKVIVILFYSSAEEDAHFRRV